MNTDSQSVKSSITFCTQMFYPELISTGLTLTELAEELMEQDIDVTVLCGPPTLTRPPLPFNRITIHNGIKIMRTMGTQFNKLHTLGKLINQLTFALHLFFKLLLSKDKHPLLVVTNPPFLGILISFIKIIKKRPFIYLVFDLYPETAENAGLIHKNGLMYKIWKWGNKLTFKHADTIISIGRCMTDKLVGKYTTSIQQKIQTIPVWCNNKNIAPLPSKQNNVYTNKWNLEDKFVILYSGNMGRFHDMKTIMDAAIELRSDENVVFLFVGDGYQKEKCQAIAHHYHLNNCIFKPYVPRDSFNHLLGTATLGLVSLASGQTGLSVPSKTFALLSKGLPVLAVMEPESEISLLLNEFKCGVTIENGNHSKLVQTILYIKKNRGTHTKMSINAKKAIEKKYAIQHISTAYAKLIQQLNERT